MPSLMPCRFSSRAKPARRPARHQRGPICPPLPELRELFVWSKHDEVRTKDDPRLLALVIVNHHRGIVRHLERDHAAIIPHLHVIITAYGIIYYYDYYF